MESPAPPTWYSAPEPAPQEIEGISVAGNSCSPHTQHKQAQRRPKEGQRNHPEATSRISSQENQGSFQEG